MISTQGKPINATHPLHGYVRQRWRVLDSAQDSICQVVWADKKEGKMPGAVVIPYSRENF